MISPNLLKGFEAMRQIVAISFYNYEIATISGDRAIGLVRKSIALTKFTNRLRVDVSGKLDAVSQSDCNESGRKVIHSMICCWVSFFLKQTNNLGSQRHR
jgi:hypothetical protein